MRIPPFKQIYSGYQNTLVHSGYWILITVYLSLLSPINAPLLAQIIATLLLMGNYIWLFYLTSLYILPRLWKSWWYIPFAIAPLFLLFFCIDYISFYYIVPAFGGHNDYEELSLRALFNGSILTFGFTMFPALGYFTTRRATKEVKRQNEREKLLINKELLLTSKELNFLKNQFHSHITFNFLQFCYNRICEYSLETADSIEIFSNMLRYSLEIKPEERTFLSKEIEYINNFIELQKVLTSKMYVEFNYTGNVEEKLILPRILITFVENAFKHGSFTDSNCPITISLTLEGDNMTFIVKNKKSKNKAKISTGVGQENVKQILALYYFNKFDLHIDNTQDQYICRLDLNLDI